MHDDFVHAASFGGFGGLGGVLPGRATHFCAPVSQTPFWVSVPEAVPPLNRPLTVSVAPFTGWRVSVNEPFAAIRALPGSVIVWTS